LQWHICCPKLPVILLSTGICGLVLTHVSATIGSGGFGAAGMAGAPGMPGIAGAPARFLFSRLARSCCRPFSIAGAILGKGADFLCTSCLAESLDGQGGLTKPV